MVQLKNFYETQSYILIEMEYLGGGQLKQLYEKRLALLKTSLPRKTKRSAVPLETPSPQKNKRKLVKAATTIVEKKEQLQLKQTKKPMSPTKQPTALSDQSQSEFSDSDCE